MDDDQLRNILNEELAKFAGQLMRSFNERLDKLEAKVDAKADAERVYTSLDGIAKRLDVDDQERIAVTSQLNRHDRWHHQAADKLGINLTTKRARTDCVRAGGLTVKY